MSSARVSTAEMDIQPPARELTDKQEAFCREYLRDLNATQAAIRAGYSEETARNIGSENLAKPDIHDRITRLFAERSRVALVDATWLLKRLVNEAEADLADIFENGELRPIDEWPLIWRQGLVVGIEVEQLFEGKGEGRVHIGTVRKVKLDPRAKRLEMIGRHIGVQAFKDALAVSPNAGAGEGVSPDMDAVQAATAYRALLAG
jgi:phage terminase small subunit